MASNSNQPGNRDRAAVSDLHNIDGNMPDANFPGQTGWDFPEMGSSNWDYQADIRQPSSSDYSLSSQIGGNFTEMGSSDLVLQANIGWPNMFDSSLSSQVQDISTQQQPSQPRPPSMQPYQCPQPQYQNPMHPGNIEYAQGQGHLPWPSPSPLHSMYQVQDISMQQQPSRPQYQNPHVDYQTSQPQHQNPIRHPGNIWYAQRHPPWPNLPLPHYMYQVSQSGSLMGFDYGNRQGGSQMQLDVLPWMQLGPSYVDQQQQLFGPPPLPGQMDRGNQPPPRPAQVPNEVDTQGLGQLPQQAGQLINPPSTQTQLLPPQVSMQQPRPPSMQVDGSPWMQSDPSDVAEQQQLPGQPPLPGQMGPSRQTPLPTQVNDPDAKTAEGLAEFKVIRLTYQARFMDSAQSDQLRAVTKDEFWSGVAETVDRRALFQKKVKGSVKAGRFIIPKDTAKIFFPKVDDGEVKEVTVEDSEGKPWRMSYSLQSGRYQLVAGWCHFIKRHGLSESDFVRFSIDRNDKLFVGHGECVKKLSLQHEF